MITSFASLRSAAAVAAGAVLVASCGSPTPETPTLQTLDRPVDVAFGCYGNIRITGGDDAQPSDPLSFQPAPLEACRIWTGGDPEDGPVPQTAPRGQEGLGETMAWFALILQQVSGTVAIARAQVKNGGIGYLTNEIVVIDGDVLAPGMNSLAVGSQPVAIATSPNGCHAVTANAGSCDLSVIDIERAVERPEGLPVVRKQAITTAGGQPLLARPAAMAYEQGDRTIGEVCTPEPDGLLYIAYPDCNAVAVVDSATGTAVASIRFDAAGTATVGDGNLTCVAQCGMRGTIVPGARPVALDLLRDDRAGTRRLAIGLDNRPVVTVVDLGVDWRPTTVEQINLWSDPLTGGDLGVIDVALSKRLGMTGFGFNDTTGIDAEFLYAVATDGTVRVVEVGGQNIECETQVDPRYLRTQVDPAGFICLPIGTPVGPRRAFARGPGIQLPNDDIPLQVAITSAGTDQSTLMDDRAHQPLTMVGHFAFIAASSGTTYTVNIDDDAAYDVFLPLTPLEVHLSHAAPHQLRDAVARRDLIGDNPADTSSSEAPPACNSRGPTGTQQNPLGWGAPRIDNPPVRTIASSEIHALKAFMMPGMRHLPCVRDTATTALPELAYAQPPDVRASLFPDLQGTFFSEVWTATWEGALSLDEPTEAIDGPEVRAGHLTVGGGAMNVLDPSRPFCAAGVEHRDYVQLRGCDPTRGDSQCGLGETCVVHPDSTLSSGQCLPKSQANQLAGLCRDFLISLRRYAVQEVSAGQLILSERRRVLRTTPVDGCTSVDQCNELAAYESTLNLEGHPKDVSPTPSPYRWACEPDPTRAGTINRCVMQCQSSNECEAGTVCSGGYCIEGPLPAPQCITGLQRYALHASDAFVVVGERTGYLHRVREDMATGRCIKAPETPGNALLAGRIPLTAPPCSGTDVTSVMPNPCKLQVEHSELFPNYKPGTCEQYPETPEIGTDPPATLGRTVITDAIRYSNPALTFHLVDPTYMGDQVCRFDRAGGRVGIPTTHFGYKIEFRQIEGFFPQAAGGTAVFPSNLVRSPDGAVWIVDEGDIIPPPNTSINTRGQVIRFDPDVVNSGAIIR